MKLCGLVVCQYRKGEGIAEAWIGHALISRQKEINFRVHAVQRRAKMKPSCSMSGSCKSFLSEVEI